jgi:hypothetical protein
MFLDEAPGIQLPDYVVTTVVIDPPGEPGASVSVPARTAGSPELLLI